MILTMPFFGSLTVFINSHLCGAGGMPDLLLWRPADRRAKLSEVKGPRDRLSEQQRAWAAALSGAGLQVPLVAAQDTRPPVNLVYASILMLYHVEAQDRA
jgi:VRR-NUC domain